MAATWQQLGWSNEQDWIKAGSPQIPWLKWVSSSRPKITAGAVAGTALPKGTLTPINPLKTAGGGLGGVGGIAKRAVDTVRGVGRDVVESIYSVPIVTPSGTYSKEPTPPVVENLNKLADLNLADPVYHIATGDELPDTPAANIARYASDPTAIAGGVGVGLKAAKLGTSVTRAVLPAVLSEFGAAAAITGAQEGAEEAGLPSGVGLAASLIAGPVGGGVTLLGTKQLDNVGRGIIHNIKNPKTPDVPPSPEQLIDIQKTIKEQEKKLRQFTKQSKIYAAQTSELERMGLPPDILEAEKTRLAEELGLFKLADETGIQYTSVDDLVVKTNAMQVDQRSGLESSTDNPIETATKDILDDPNNAKSRTDRAKDAPETPEERMRRIFEEEGIGEGVDPYDPFQVEAGEAAKSRLPSEGKTYPSTDPDAKAEGIAGFSVKKSSEVPGPGGTGLEPGLGRSRMEFPSEAGATSASLLSPDEEIRIALDGVYRDLPDTSQSVIDDIIFTQRSFIDNHQSYGEMNAAGQARRKVAAAVSGEHIDPKINQVLRLKEEAYNGLVTANVADALRKNTDLDPEGIFKRVQAAVDKIGDIVVRQSFKDPDELASARLALRESSKGRTSFDVSGVVNQVLETQQLLKTMNLSMDWSIVGQQLEAALRRGNIPLTMGTMSQLIAKQGTEINNPMFFQAYKEVHPNRMVWLVNRGLAISHDAIKKDIKDLRAETAKSRLGRGVEKITNVNEAMAELQYGQILAGARVRAAEGLLIQAQVIHRILSKAPVLKKFAGEFDIHNPVIARKFIDQANMIGSASRGATTRRRALVEDLTMLTPRMTRAGIAELGSLFDVTTGAGILNTINTLGSYTTYYGSLYGIHAALKGELGRELGIQAVGEFSLDPTDTGFGLMVLDDGRTLDWTPQGSFYRVLRNSLNASDPAELIEAWAKYGYGRENIFLQSGTNLTGIGYAREGGIVNQVLPSDQDRLEWGWFGENEWDDPLTWEQRLGQIVPLPPLSIGMALGSLFNEGLTGAALVDSTLAMLGQQEYSENSFGASNRIAKQLYGEGFIDLDSYRQAKVVSESIAAGDDIDWQTMSRPFRTALATDSWNAVKELGASAPEDSYLAEAIQHDSYYDYIAYQEEVLLRDGFSPEVVKKVLQDTEKAFEQELKRVSGGESYQDIQHELALEVLRVEPAIYDAVVEWYMSKETFGGSSAIPNWVIEGYEEITGEKVR